MSQMGSMSVPSGRDSQPSFTALVDDETNKEKILHVIQLVIKKALFEKDFNAPSTEGQPELESKRGPTNEDGVIYHGVMVATSFAKICEKHRRLTDHIQGLLNALDGSGRIAKALKTMHEAMVNTKNSLCVDHDHNNYLDPMHCSKRLDACGKITAEVTQAFWELGVYSSNFYDASDSLIKLFESIASRFDAEYGSCDKLAFDPYLDSTFSPLIEAFKTYIKELTIVAEKGIKMVRRSQEFLTRRYLNLTAIATFLSGVTATMLSITIDSPPSSLALAMNTFWLVSLVLSAASAIYSLLVMSWHQSTVRQPHLSLPSIFHVWFRNGSTVTLILTALTFLAGLCCFAFRNAGHEKDAFTSAGISATVAGIHATPLFLLSAWFLFEQWREIHAASWVKHGDGYFIPLKAVKKSDEGSGNLHFFIEYHMKKIANLSHIVLPRKHQQDYKSAPSQPNGSSAGDECVLFENVLQFSLCSRFLASAHQHFVSIYDMCTFDILCIIEGPDPDPVKQILWNSNVSQRNDESSWLSEEFKAGLLVRSSRAVSTWQIGSSEPHHKHLGQYHLDAENNYEEEFGPAYWSDTEPDEFVISLKSHVLLLDHKCEFTGGYSLITEGLLGYLVETTPFRGYLVGLAHIEGDSGQPRDCIIIRSRDLSYIGRHDLRSSGHTSLITSPETGQLILRRSDGTFELGELDTKSSARPRLLFDDANMSRNGTCNDQETYGPAAAITFYGNNDALVIGFLKDKVTAFHRGRNVGSLSPLHVFTTAEEQAIPEKPISFAINRNPKSKPYMFAFGDEDGSVTVWSVQSNTVLLDKNKSFGKPFIVRDRLDVYSSGRYVSLLQKRVGEEVEEVEEGEHIMSSNMVEGN